jgi:predicted amidohydrolase
MTVRIACCQISPDVEHPAGNAALARRAIESAVDEGAQIVVLPELVNSGYMFRSSEEARSAAVPPDGELLGDWSELAAHADALVVGGFCELAPDGRVFNSSALVDGTGVRAVYRKLHLWDEENKWFVAGEEPAPVIDTRFGRIGLAICYDIEFPELTRGLALQGAELIVIPANWPRDEPANGTPVLHSLASMTGYWNKTFVAVCDRSGTERGCEFEGGSVIAGPDGVLRAGPVVDRAAMTIVGDCDLAKAKDKRTSENNDAFADRRAEHYATALLDH